MLKIFYTTYNGQSIELYSYPFRVYLVEGLGDVEAEIQAQKSPYQDGSTFLDAVLQERHITIGLKIIGDNEVELSQRKRRLSSIFNPKLGLGILKVAIANEIYEIEAAAESVPFYPDGKTNRGKYFQKAQINLICPKPYWQSPIIRTEELNAFVPKLKYPTTYPVTYGTRGSEATLTNDGHVATPVEIVFEGPAVEPIITNRTTGEFIKIRRELGAGEKLVINTAFGRDRKVEIDRGNGVIENAWGYIDIWESALFQLEVGSNIIEHNALSGYGSVTVSFKNQYVGI
ncbi:phage tail domain-containing protein [Halalkalibacter krulwichiae]|uniref:Phage tail protein n=1 Tax=Halalkalibacter krulwichiae TaxID=199441 RepID=A0A1X9M5S8_9BACI|nr:phage tail domain-containing protein [Halalkalibacter krulwichiae]ARK28799.1 Phage tail protein [Halalkalibacter krulwichiae]